MAGGEFRGVLTLERVGQIEAFAFLAGVDHHHAHVRAATQIGNAQRLPALDDQRRVSAARDGFFQ